MQKKIILWIGYGIIQLFQYQAQYNFFIISQTTIQSIHKVISSTYSKDIYTILCNSF